MLGLLADFHRGRGRAILFRYPCTAFDTSIISFHVASLEERKRPGLSRLQQNASDTSHSYQERTVDHQQQMPTDHMALIQMKPCSGVAVVQDKPTLASKTCGIPRFTELADIWIVKAESQANDMADMLTIQTMSQSTTPLACGNAWHTAHDGVFAGGLVIQCVICDLLTSVAFVVGSVGGVIWYGCPFQIAAFVL
ncbi:uncharacterized protein BO80DRAFT_23790 [Aspergillus ibericus CBS 121593]|uniref:Uncharacterized protein n=1 Tax=Aspergillus ibericus CBS 121593 TaxID=1448316 RepID=A0A395H603_9EURO|nr:hypothetical protein BO80DRAFT_23790 [Aspergillus ibericus CBS 121593]RAL03050.1 hypothetical protein BO80DRAFT_23790 [Aspergillus ibericus CBS 121593]